VNAVAQPRQNGNKLRVVVVGAGIVGASIAYHLALRNVSVTLVDKGKSGTGASSHSFAWINAGAKSPVSYHDFNRRSLEMWNRFAQQLGADVGLRWGGKISWEATPERAKELEKMVWQLQSWGYPTRFIDEAELRQLEPGLSPGPVAAAEFSEIEGQVDPQQVVDACVKRVRELGGVAQEDTAVGGLTLTRNGSRVQSVQTSRGDIPCDVVVLAAGVDTTTLAAMAEVNVPQEESPGVVIRTDPRPKLLRSVPVVYAPPIDASQQEIHLRQTADGTLMIGEGSQESLSRDDSQSHANDLLARAIHYLPALAGAKAIPVPVGYRPMPLDGYPVLGFAEAAPNIYIALTHSGVTLAPLIGELAAIEIVDGARVKALQDYRPERFV
jgi:glycine/D-amino acid oxidase-like deaminating enzyme